MRAPLFFDISPSYPSDLSGGLSASNQIMRTENPTLPWMRRITALTFDIELLEVDPEPAKELLPIFPRHWRQARSADCLFPDPLQQLRSEI